MSPTPPISNTELCNGVTQPEYNPGSDQASIQPAATLLTNGHAGEVKSAYFNHEECVKSPKKRRNSKTGTKQQQPNGAVKKRGRPPKVKTEDVPSKQSKITDTLKKAKRTVNRFKDVTKEELMERFLPDRIKHDLDILIIGINPGLYAAYKGHHYAGPGNHFWSCLNMSGLIDQKMTSDNDEELPNYGIGFSTIVERTTPGAKDLSSKEIREGAKRLIEKIQLYKPKIAVFNGKGIYEIFSKEIFGQKKKDFVFGTQANKIPETDTFIYVMASSSARCAQFPRAQDKVHFYVKLKQLRDSIRGVKTDDAPVCEVAYTFDLKKATELAKVQNIKQERIDPEYESNDATKNNSTTNYSMFATTSGATASGVQSTSHNATDVNNNAHNAIEVTTVNNNTGAQQMDVNGNKNNNAVKIMPQKVAKEDNNITARHAHLVHYLRNDADSQDPGPSHGGRKGTQPISLSPANPKLQQDVSEEARQERVGNWVREQQSLEYDSEPPMGIEPEDEGAPSGQESSVAAPVEIDGASQLSAVSAGVSGSASESTSGYGSVDASSRRVRLDRVEMWVLEQQHVLRHNAGNQQQIQQSIQAASNLQQQQGIPVTPQTIQNFLPNSNIAGWTQPVTHFGNVTPSFGVMHTQGGGIVTPMISGQMFQNRNTQKPTTHASLVADQMAGPSVSAGRSSPFGFNRVSTPSRREGGSSSSFGTSVRPPVPLFSSWGGEESNSGGSAISSPVVQLAPNPTTIPSPVQPFVTAPSAPIRNLTAQNFSNALAMSWQSTGSNNMLTPHFNM